MEDLKHAVYDQLSFYAKFRSDLETARGLVLIQSPELAARRIESLADSLQDCMRRGVRVCVFTDEQLDKDAIALLRRQGVHVTLRQGINEKLIVIDENIFWQGSINALSHYNTGERMTRWISRVKVHDAIISHKLNSCEQCGRLQTFSVQPDHLSDDWKQIVLIGKLIAMKRTAIGLSQRDLAERAGLQQSIISEIEHGKRNAKLSTMLRVCSQLGLELLATPWHLAPAVKQMVDFSPPEQLVKSADVSSPFSGDLPVPG